MQNITFIRNLLVKISLHVSKTLCVLVITFFFSQMCWAQTVLDNAYGNLNFGGTGVTISYYPTGSTGKQVGNIVLYRNVRTISGTVIDCYIRVDEISTGSVITEFDQAAVSGSGYTFNSARFFSPFALFPNGKSTGSGGSATFTLQFIKGGTFSYNSSTKKASGQNVILLNVKINTYDVDGNGDNYSNQSVRFGGFKSSELDVNTNLFATYNIATGLTAFRSNSHLNTVNALEDKNRVMVTYDSLSTFIIKHSGGGICYSFIDFGLGMPYTVQPQLNYQISGTIFDDGNGLWDNEINGAPIETAILSTLVINLTNNSNTVIRSQVINADGTYLIAAVPAGNYKLILSNTLSTIGSTLTQASLPANWIHTAEYFGKGIGSDGMADGALANIVVSSASLFDANFGINRRPEALDFDKEIANPMLGALLVLGRQETQILKALDLEDGTIGFGRRLAIVSLPTTGNKLIYNGAEIRFGLDGINSPSATNPHIIASYDTAGFAILFTGLSSTSVSFQYSMFDSANAEDLSPATYTLRWQQALPVEFINVGAKLTPDGLVKVEWSTASEVNNETFQVERMLRGETEFSQIGEVDGAGNSSSIINYTFIDNQDWNSTLAYYRIKQIDYDGTFDYSIVTPVKKQQNYAVSVFPSPSTDVFTVSAQHEDEIEIRILDSRGVLIFKDSFQGEIKITTDEFVPGIYFIKLTVNHGVKTIRHQVL